MPRTTMYNPLTSDAKSSWLAGLTEACNRLSGALNMKTETFTDLTLPELYISEDDRYRIYEAPLGNKLWLSTPAPVIKKNGNTILPETDGFTIDYLGGSISFEENMTLQAGDVVTASATHITDGSNQIESILLQINTISDNISTYKGSFDTLSDLQSAYPTGESGDYAIVNNEKMIYLWYVPSDSTGTPRWVSSSAQVDLSSYYTKTEMNNLLNEKEPVISAKGTNVSDDDFYYGGRKTWISIFTKVLGTVLTGLVSNDPQEITASDTLLVALGKLQAQIDSMLPTKQSTGSPTTSTVGELGQDYVNTSNGDKYHLTSIYGSGTNKNYDWERYGNLVYQKETFTSGIGAFESEENIIIESNFFQANSRYVYLIYPSDKQNDEGAYGLELTAYEYFLCVPLDIKTAGVLEITSFNRNVFSVDNIENHNIKFDCIRIDFGEQISNKNFAKVINCINYDTDTLGTIPAEIDTSISSDFFNESSFVYKILEPIYFDDGFLTNKIIISDITRPSEQYKLITNDNNLYIENYSGEQYKLYTELNDFFVPGTETEYGYSTPLLLPDGINSQDNIVLSNLSANTISLPYISFKYYNENILEKNIDIFYDILDSGRFIIDLSNSGTSNMVLKNSTGEHILATEDYVSSNYLGKNSNSVSATKLATGRTIQVNLSSTSSASFDGTANITPGVTGTLTVSRGGTGSTTASGALSNLGITYGTGAYTPGSTNMTTGAIYLQYV